MNHPRAVFSLKDTEYMELALNQARSALAAGDFPVGAVLVIDGKVIDTARNLIRTRSDSVSHAEAILLSKYSALIKSVRTHSETILYTSLEPCIMCLGMAVLHRIPRIVYGCPDPFTGAGHLAQDSLPPGYRTIWPALQGGLLQEQSYELVMKFMAEQGTAKWEEAIQLYERMYKNWKKE